MTKHMVRIFLSIFLLVTAINISGCSLALDLATSHIDAKIDMDRQGETNQPVDIVWEATQLAVDELGIIVDSKNYDKKEAEVGGHIGDLDYIRIYLYKLTPNSTKVGIQARTALLPMTRNGYDLAYAKKIMDTINKNINQVLTRSKDQDNTYRPIEEAKLAPEKGEKININKYLDNREGLTLGYNVTWQVNEKEGSGQGIDKILGLRTLNGKNTTPIQADFNNFMTGKKNSSLIFYVFDDTGYYLFAKQESDMIEPKISDEPDYEFKAPYFVGTTWEDKGKTILFARKISVPTTVTIEKNDDVITVPAGTFEKCLRVKSYCHVKNIEGYTIKIEAYMWWAPGIGFIKSIRKEEGTDPSLGKGGTLTYQLVSHSRL